MFTVKTIINGVTHICELPTFTVAALTQNDLKKYLS
jgi:hypothetical protein